MEMGSSISYLFFLSLLLFFPGKINVHFVLAKGNAVILWGLSGSENTQRFHTTTHSHSSPKSKAYGTWDMTWFGCDFSSAIKVAKI